MSPPKVFVSRMIPQNGLDRLRKHAELDVWTESVSPPRPELLNRVRGCDGLLCLLSDRVDAELLDAAGPNLKVISNYAVGVNNIDLGETRRRKIPVGNTPDVLTDATADVAVLLLLAAARRVKEATASVREGTWKAWEPTGLLGVDLAGRTLGIVGMGRIGTATAQRLVGGWNMKLVYTARSAKEDVDRRLGGRHVAFDELLESSDFISIHTDLNPETERLFGASAFDTMKSDAVLVNTARGGIIDQEALLDALVNNKLRAAGLDVTDPEPLPPDHPLVDLPNCLILPHLGSATNESRAAMAEIAADNVIAGLQGRPLRCPVRND